jgi:hypothetical protein
MKPRRLLEQLNASIQSRDTHRALLEVCELRVKLQVQEARAWLLDCGAPTDLVDDATDESIKREVERQYEGGWNQFLADTY